MSALGVLGLLLKDCTIFQPILSCQFFKCINYKQQIFRNLIFISKTSKIYTKDITTGMTLPAPGRQQTRNAQYILISGPKKTELQILPTPVIQLSTWAVMDLNCFCLFIAPMYTVRICVHGKVFQNRTTCKRSVGLPMFVHMYGINSHT